MAHLSLVPRHRAGPELKAAYDRVSTAWGFSSAPPLATQIMQCFSNRPAYVEAAGMGYFYIGWAAETPRTVLETAAVLISKENDCFY